MNNAQSNTHTMHNAVIANFNKKKEAWQSIVPLAEEFTLFEVSVKDIEDIDFKKTGSTTKGYTSNKDLKLDQVLQSMETLIKRVRPYAVKIKDEVLLESINYSTTKFKDLGQENIFPAARKVLNAIKAIANKLESYKVDTEYLAKIEEEINTTEPLIAERDSIGDTNASLTKLLDKRFAEIKPILKNIDDMVESMVENEEFIMTHQKARVTIDRGGSNPKEPVKPA